MYVPFGTKWFFSGMYIEQFSEPEHCLYWLYALLTDTSGWTTRGVSIDRWTTRGGHSSRMMSAMNTASGVQHIPSSNDGRMVHAKALYATDDPASSRRGFPHVRVWGKLRELHNNYVMRTSCDCCGKRRHKCDGNSTHTCRLESKRAAILFNRTKVVVR